MISFTFDSPASFRRTAGLIVLCFGLLCCLVVPSLSANDKIPFLPEDTISDIEAKIEANGYNFKVEANWVTRLPSAAKERLFSRRLPVMPSYRQGSSYVSSPLVVRSVVELPEQFDWRNFQGHSYIGPVRNQGGCGSCYAFGACAAAEGAYNVAMGRYDGKCLDLSEAFLAFCLDQYYDGFTGCAGSSYDYEELDALVERGVCNEIVYPYSGVDEGCVAGAESAPRVKFAGWHRVSCGNIEAIKSAIMSYGTVDAAVNVTSAFQAYASGIFSDENTECDTACYYAETNHCIALVGWQDVSADGDGYWILRNSWGTNWGENGYMRIAYRSAHVACAVCYLEYSVPVTAQVKGAKWNDYDADGVWDSDEPGLSHWKIYADLNHNLNCDPTEPYSITDQNGNYVLDDLSAGTYVIAEEVQAGWTQTFPTASARSNFRGAPSTRFDELSNAELAKIEYMIIDSPPQPPAGYSRTIVRQISATAVCLNNVPTSRWTYGCSATSAGMLFGYYDRIGYSNMYSGPANNGVAPLTDLGQGDKRDYPISGSCSIIATMNGFDGRTVPGHVDDYWTGYNDPGADPWESIGVEHLWGGCTADFMGTNQWKWDANSDGSNDYNRDGSTTYHYYPSGAKLYDPVPSSSNGLPQTALCHGLRLFAESRGYTVTENYNQVIDVQASGAGQGFTFLDFKREIDNGYPVLVHVVGHTMLGVGYDGANQTIYIHDTWDNSRHEMVWGGEYSGMMHKAVTVIHLEPVVMAGGTHRVVLGEGETVTGKNFGNHASSATNTVKIDWVTPVYDTIIQRACDSAYSGDSVLIQIGNFNEELIFDVESKDLFLRGGFDSGFNVQIGMTNIIGKLTISEGTLTVERLTIQ